MSKFKVTEEQWRQVLGTNVWLICDGGGARMPSCGGGMANDFVDLLNQRSTMTDSRRKVVFRLPTEAEWEYACRAGSTGRFCCAEADLPKYAWIENKEVLDYDHFKELLHPVGQKLPNRWGLFDMHGFPGEVCSDWYGPYLTQMCVDPKGPETNGNWDVVLRGGVGFPILTNTNLDRMRCAARFRWEKPCLDAEYIGVRLVATEGIGVNSR